MKIGVPKEYFDEWLDAKVKETIMKAIDHMKSLWAEIREISLPMTKYGVTTYYILMPAEVATNLARLDGLKYWYKSLTESSSIDEMYQNNRGESLWEEPQRRSIIGNYVLSAGFYDAYYVKAAKIRTLIIQDFDTAFEEVDAIVAPCSPEAAWKLWEKTDDPLKMYLADAFTIPASLAGLPGISVPCGFVEDDWEKLPVWIQILTPRLEEQRLFEIANVYEKSACWREHMIPQGFED
jgi:aspartyl-tRNA(Asn)/glutamyl-tRNA(Gln) amidotransferase subunit A